MSSMDVAIEGRGRSKSTCSIYNSSRRISETSSGRRRCNSSSNDTGISDVGINTTVSYVSTLCISCIHIPFDITLLPDDSCVISAGYLEDNKKADVQIGITGKCKYREHPDDAALRELVEELGIDIDPSNLVYLYTTSIGYHVYIADVNNCSFVTELPCDHMRGHDDRSNRVFVVPFVSAENVQLTLQNTVCLDPTESDLGYHAAIPKSIIEGICQYRSNKNDRSGKMYWNVTRNVRER
jgi:hypothetical protein